MKASLTAIFLSTIAFALAGRDVASEFKAAEIKPDILRDAPTQFLQIKYGDKSVALGNEMTPTEVKDIPEVSWDFEGDEFYTLVMTGIYIIPIRHEKYEKFIMDGQKCLKKKKYWEYSHKIDFFEPTRWLIKLTKNRRVYNW